MNLDLGTHATLGADFDIRSGRRDMVQELSGLRLARREIKNGCDLDADRELVGMRQAVAYFGEYKPFLGSNLYDGSGFQGLRHQQFHSVLRGIQKLPLDLDLDPDGRSTRIESVSFAGKRV